MISIDVHPKYEVLFKIPLARQVIDGKSKDIDLKTAKELIKIDTIIVTGGRFSAKSFTLALASADWVRNYTYRILYTRYTLSSAEDTIIPDFKEKLDMFGYGEQYSVKKDRITSKVNKSKVVFKGIKTSAGNQTASLKSLKDFNIFMCDEAEELLSFDDWKKIYLSMRTSDVQNMSILILNPTDKDFWIYREFFELRGVKEDFNGQLGNVLYINTDYRDVIQYVPENILREYNRLKEEDIEEYNHICLGKWRDIVVGALYNRKSFIFFNLPDINYDKITMRIGFIDVASVGIDYLSMPIGYVVGEFVYIIDWYFSQENTDITIPLCADYAQNYGIDYLGVEGNGMGSIFGTELQKMLNNHTTMIMINQNTNKHSRILNSTMGVTRKIVFRKDVEPTSSYGVAVRQFFRYNRDKSLNDWDDSPDSITGLYLLAQDLQFS